MMKQKKVKFVSADEAKEFVSIASGCDFDVNVFYNRMIIDAKSLLGVLSLDPLTQTPVSLRVVPVTSIPRIICFTADSATPI